MILWHQKKDNNICLYVFFSSFSTVVTQDAIVQCLHRLIHSVNAYYPIVGPPKLHPGGVEFPLKYHQLRFQKPQRFSHRSTGFALGKCSNPFAQYHKFEIQMISSSKGLNELNPHISRKLTGWLQSQILGFPCEEVWE